MIDNDKIQGEWKIQLAMTNSFISSKDSDETRTTHTKNDDIKIMIDHETDEIIEELLNSLLQENQKGLEKK